MDKPQLKYYLLHLFLLLNSFLLNLYPSDAELCNRKDKKVLLEIQEAMGNPASLASSWNLATDCCTGWAITCDSNGRVTSFIAFKSDAYFKIPSSIGRLKYLQSFQFITSPNLHGPLPDTLTKLKLLRNLRVSSTNLNGSIPSFIGKITTLNSLDLSYNNLTGPIPSSLGNLHNLYDLDLSANRLTGSIPATFNSSNLPNPFGLHLALNKFSGPIPQSVGTVNLTFIEFTLNNFTGDATFLFGKEKTGLTYVSLSRNSFSFDFSKVVIPNNLVDLDISNNHIFGSLPPSIILPPFDEFNVSYNKLCGRIPTGGFLQEFDASAFMDNQCLCGNPLPPCT
ncbi:Polygalacturonase inhibitor-like protein [Drosera capensis]